MVVGQIVTCNFNFNNISFLGNYYPLMGELVQIAEIKQFYSITYLRFEEYSMINPEVFYNSTHFS